MASCECDEPMQSPRDDDDSQDSPQKKSKRCPENNTRISHIADLEALKSNDNGLSTFSSFEQEEVEQKVIAIFRNFKELLEEEIEINEPTLLRSAHMKYLIKNIRHLSTNYECLDASQPWLCYWTLHAMEVLSIPIPDDLASDIVAFLKKCQQPSGGFGGGPYQQAHLAPTYGAVNSLCIIGTEEAYNAVDRENLYKWLTRLHDKTGGSFSMHEGGEADVRGVYCAASVARLTNIYTLGLFEKTSEWVVSCQTYEGGFGGAPGLEAHGGYSFCAFAGLTLMNKENSCDIKSLLRWTANRQMRLEGGFQGRTNKLVDACYSFWQGGVFPLLHRALAVHDDPALSYKHWMFDQRALQDYILLCCQSSHGGLFDKPGKHTDLYHTCYALSGLSVAQHFDFGKLHEKYRVGIMDNELKITHPTFNICPVAVVQALQYFSTQPVPGNHQASA
ncbi:protein farnesyltransferase subunit beta-like [Lineus longissimus]|uniref:protein farnesyltransferase subunit beta-like n=1 Tax=Lineus longissimus TaxID=88925 RepID=UPI002B4D8ED7